MTAQPEWRPQTDADLAPNIGVRTYRVSLTRVTSMIIMTYQRRAVYAGTLEQLERSARSVLVYNLLLGWWGFPFGLIWTPTALVRNAKAMKQIRSLAAAPPTF
jgi:hypothetical protein